MKVVLWLAQAIAALLFFSGGAYKLSSSGELAAEMPALPGALWAALGLFELVGSLLLFVPAATKKRPALTPLAAAALAVEAWGLAAFYASHSLELSAANPMVWALVMGALAAFVAWGRSRARPV